MGYILWHYDIHLGYFWGCWKEIKKTKYIQNKNNSPKRTKKKKQNQKQKKQLTGHVFWGTHPGTGFHLFFFDSFLFYICFFLFFCEGKLQFLDSGHVPWGLIQGLGSICFCLILYLFIFYFFFVCWFLGPFFHVFLFCFMFVFLSILFFPVAACKRWS